MNLFELLTLSIQALNAVVVALSAWLVAKRISKQHAWNRRSAAEQICAKYWHREIEGCRRSLDAKGWNQFTCSEVISKDPDYSVRAELKQVLNYFEGIAMGVKHHLYEEEVVYDYFSYVLPSTSTWVTPFLDGLRATSKSQSIFREMEVLGWHPQNA